MAINNFTSAIMGFKGLFRGVALASVLALSLVDAATLSVSTTGGNASSPFLYGLMFEVSCVDFREIS